MAKAKQSGPGPQQLALAIDASPTKELFIAMLTRDVALIPAIVDLADNSTDGARRTRGDRSWKGLHVKITTKAREFVIDDNCGGITPDVARRYAFRFGRPSEAPSADGEVGRFGVGMKRGLFKLGRHFHILSTTKKTRFEVTIDVDEWAAHKEWQFAFDAPPIEDGNYEDGERGTVITVKRLHPQVLQHFQESGFLENLRAELTSRLEQSILKGLLVSVDGVTCKAHVRRLVASAMLAPAKKTIRLKGPTGKNVEVELWCGVGVPDSPSVSRSESGWYVFCNGRMLLEADKTSAAGWGVEDEGAIPAYHPQYNGFRGFAYLEADDAADLPWNTTKTALDTDHAVYRGVKQEMIAIARPVIDFFNKKKDENDAARAAGKGDAGKLQALLDQAKSAPLDKIQARAAFITPKAVTAKSSGASLQRIVFERPTTKALKVKASLGVSSWREVGEGIFDYYLSAEHGDE
jgi:hypothetical protein